MNYAAKFNINFSLLLPRCNGVFEKPLQIAASFAPFEVSPDYQL
jgi:hypothetical protein